MEEILIKGVDGAWYVLRNGQLIPKDAAVPTVTPMPVVQPVDPVRTPEIAPPAKKLTLPPPQTAVIGGEDGMERVIADAVAAAKLSFTDPSLTKRFKLLVASRLREVRRADDVHALLVRDTKVGGLGLSESEAQRVALVIEAAFVEFHKKWAAVEAERAAAVQKAREEAAKKTQQIMGLETSDLRLETKETRATSNERLEKQQQKVEPFKNSSAATSKPRPADIASPQVSVANRPSPVVNPPSASALPQVPVAKPPVSSTITDIRKPKLYGPADELREMTLADFRRMGSAQEAVGRVRAKIDFIGSESLTRRREALAAWKQSAVYALYTDMMSNAIAHGKPIEQEMNERMKTGKPNLTIDEVDAIMGLNEQLRN